MKLASMLLLSPNAEIYFYFYGCFQTAQCCKGYNRFTVGWCATMWRSLYCCMP